MLACPKGPTTEAPCDASKCCPPVRASSNSIPNGGPRRPSSISDGVVSSLNVSNRSAPDLPILVEKSEFKLGIHHSRGHIVTPRDSETPPMSLETEPDSGEDTPMVEGKKSKKVRVVSSSKQSNV